MKGERSAYLSNMSLDIPCSSSRLALIPLPGGHTADGISGLIDYVEAHRLHDFERTLCRKFLGYALGRSVILSDQPLLQKMEQRLRTEGRFSVLFETVVLSPQFLQQRGREYAEASR